MSLKLACPDCSAAIQDRSVNVEADIARCDCCGALHEASDLARRHRVLEFQGYEEPTGVWFRKDMDSIEIGAVARHVGHAVALTLFSLVWNGFIVFLWMGAMSAALGVTIGWEMTRSGGQPMDQDEAVFVSFFLSIFVLLGVMLVFATLVSWFGGVRVILRGDEGWVSSGLGVLALQRRFRVSDVTGVEIRQRGDDPPRDVIEIEIGHRTIRIESVMHGQRRRWFAAKLAEHLLLKG